MCNVVLRSVPDNFISIIFMYNLGMINCSYIKIQASGKSLPNVHIMARQLTATIFVTLITTVITSDYQENGNTVLITTLSTTD